MNDIIKLLDIEDENLTVKDVVIEGGTKTIVLETELAEHYCPRCSSKMYSRGIKPRSVLHPVMQDGYRLMLVIRRRSWRCTNTACRYEYIDSFKLVGRNRRISNATELLVVEAFRDIESTAAEIGRRFHMSDHQAMDIFEKYVKMKRLNLTEFVSVDEVYLDIDSYCKYALVIQDFATGNPIDLVKSRQKRITEPYFVAIPRQERLRVKYLISDMYNPYLAYVDSYFPNAVPVVDSFHVIQWINGRLDAFLRRLLREFRNRDQEKADALSKVKGHPVCIPESDEVYLLKQHRWVLLKNRDSIDYTREPRKDYHFGYFMDTYALEDRFLGIHPDMGALRELKEMYVRFNKSCAGCPEKAANGLDELIELYSECGYGIFEEFSSVLKAYRQPVINSFVMTEKTGKDAVYLARLSNGPIESLNRKVKDLKRNGRGYLNFDHIRNRFLFATRTNPSISGR